jgi:hypothetical protein
MINFLIASYFGTVVAWWLQDPAGLSFLIANGLAAPATIAAWAALTRAGEGA